MSKSSERASGLIDVGRISGVFGVQGWVKIQSGTEPAENIFNYKPWWLKTRHGVKAVEVDAHRPHGKGYVAHIKGVDDRDQAEALGRVTVAIERTQIPALEAGEFYWHELVGLQVLTRVGEQWVSLGRVSHLLETGANDVLVVQGDSDSIDQRERLIPYVPEQFLLDIDPQAGIIRVDWDPEF